MPVKKGTSKAKAPAVAESKEDCCAKCDAKIEAVELKIADLEKKLKGFLKQSPEVLKAILKI